MSKPNHNPRLKAGGPSAPQQPASTPTLTDEASIRSPVQSDAPAHKDSAPPLKLPDASPAKPTGPFPGVVYCEFCLYGQDAKGTSANPRRCRGGIPTPHPVGLRSGSPVEPHAIGVWPEVRDWDYCGAGKPLP